MNGMSFILYNTCSPLINKLLTLIAIGQVLFMFNSKLFAAESDGISVHRNNSQFWARIFENRKRLQTNTHLEDLSELKYCHRTISEMHLYNLFFWFLCRKSVHLKSIVAHTFAPLEFSSL